MTSEEAIKVADEVLRDHNGNPLNDIQRDILRGSLAGKGYERMEGYAHQHIKNEGKKLWDLLSEALGEKVSKKNFKGALEKRFKSGGIVPKPPILPKYDKQTWVGRETAVSDLLLRLQGKTRIIWIAGISGIGKTALGECLASQAWEIDPWFQWIQLEIREGGSPYFVSVAAALLEEKLDDYNFNSQTQNNPEQLAKRLLHKLESYPYWIQLDSVERLLNPKKPIEFVDPYWVTFLERYLTECNRSRLVLTAQALPDVLVQFDEKYSNFWSEIRLSGLSEVNQRLEFFAKRGVDIESSNRNILARIAHIYEGHPLTLTVIAKDIKNHPGDVSDYWQANQQEFEQVAGELQNARRLNETQYNQALYRQVRKRIKKSIEKLSTDALDLLCRSSVFRRPVSKQFWLRMIRENRSFGKQNEAYFMLQDRALVETERRTQGQDTIRQHNLIRDIAYNLLQQDLNNWKFAEKKASEIWLSDYKAVVDAPNIEKVRGYLEAFHHLIEVGEVGDWDKADEILHKRLSETGKELGEQLGIWGYYREQIEIYRKLCGKYSRLDSLKKLLYLENIGIAYSFLDDYENAFTFFNQALVLSRELEQREEEARILHQIGISKADQGKDDEAHEEYKRAFAICQEYNFHKLRASVLSDIARVKAKQGRYDEALRDCQDSLNSYYREPENEREPAWIYLNFGDILSRAKKHEEAKLKIDRSLEIFEKEENKTGVSWCHLGLANLELSWAYEKSDVKCSSKHEELAYYHANKALTEFSNDSQNQNQGGVAWARTTLGRIEFKRGNFPTANEHYLEALKILRELNNLTDSAPVLEAFACLLTKKEQPYQQLLNPAYLFSAAKALRKANKYPVPFRDLIEYNHGIKGVKRKIDKDKFQDSLKLGKEVSIEEVILEILALENKD